MYDHVGVSWLSLIILDPEMKRQEPPGILAAPVATLHPAALARPVSARRLQKDEREPHKVRSVTYAEIKEEHQTGRNGNGICGLSFEKLFTRLSCEESFTRLSLRLPEASVKGTTREQCFHIDFKRSFLRILGGEKNLQWKEKIVKTVQTHTHTHTYNESVVFFLVLGDFPVEDRERSFSLWRVLREEHNWFLRTPIPKTRGKCRRPTCADDILKSYGGVVSCPSYSKANMWRRRRGCLVAQSCPSWLGESPREVYLIWCWRRNKQINGTLLHNTLLPFPLHCIPSVIAALATETITTRERKGTNAAHGQLMVGASRVSRLSLIFSPKVKLRQCDHFNFQGPVWILSVWMAGSTFIKTEWGLLQNGNISANLWGRHVVKSLCSKLHNFIF